MMNIAILHYHLNRGGVTQVIANHLRALNGQVSAGSRLPVALVFGGRRDGWSDDLASQLDRLDLTLHPVAELDYENLVGDSKDLATRLHGTLHEAGFHPEETVVHVHNHALGKNVALPGAIATLACLGYSCLLHIHDFAEDFRPENYRQLAPITGERSDDSSGFLYPQSRQIHFAVLNSRDHSILSDAGVDPSRLHLLPNPVAEVDALPPHEESRGRALARFGISSRERLVLYPVRGIRRKNLGEALLWSAMAKGRNCCFGLTLPPLNPVEQTSYARWKECAAADDLRFIFEMGGPGGLPFVDNLAAADFILTTSVAEGFGLVFLEAWLASCNLVGRDLPEITTDFVGAGLEFPGLNSKFWVPVNMLNEKVVRSEIADSFRSVLASYGQPQPAPEVLDQEIDELMPNGQLDFAQCGVLTQTKVIKKVASETASRDVLLEANPWFDDALALQSTDSALIDRNAEIVRREYSVANCGRRLMAIYKSVDSSDRDDAMKPLKNRHRILEQFLNLSRFHPLRVES